MNKRTNKSRDSLVQDFAKVEALLVALIQRVLSSGNLGQLRARRRASSEAAALLRQLTDLTPSKVEFLIRSGYLAGREASGAPNKTLSKTDQNAIALLVDGLQGRLQDGITIVGRRTDDIFRKEGLRAAALALAGTGAVDQSSIDAFRRRLEREGLTSFIDSAGRRWRLESYAAMATKTIVMEAVNVGAENLILERGFDLIQIAHPGRYKPDPLCDEHHNKVYSLTGRARGVPRMNPGRRPPYHPHCEHFIKLAPGAVRERSRARRAA